MKKPALNIVWLRRDLRLEDNAAVYRALRAGSPVLPIFIFDTEILGHLKNKSDKRVQFIHEQLVRLRKELEALGSTLMVYRGTPETVFAELVKSFSIGTVFLNHDYEPSALARDAKIQHLLREAGVKFESFKDQCIFEKKEVVKDDLKPYTVFTPYKTKWLKNLSPFYLKSYPTKGDWAKRPTRTAWVELKDLGFTSDPSCVFPPLEFHKAQLKTYAETRDFPALDSTSRLGLHLRFGTLSIRECARVARATSDVWLSELVWRDFFMQILFHYPHVQTESFRPEYDRIKWRNKPDEFQAWCEGRTGYAFVDAGMRELNATGFMHNRARMITASFLTKHLLVDWRLGEAYFAEKLLDYDLAANNGNWQWAAGTGCDAAPYFRVFSPELQRQRFDKKNEYVKRWVREFETGTYVSPIVEHSFARERALETYKKALKSV